MKIIISFWKNPRLSNCHKECVLKLLQLHFIMQSLCGVKSAFATATVPLSATATMTTWKPDTRVLCLVSPVY